MRMLLVMDGEMKHLEIHERLELRREEHFRKAYLQPTLELGVIEMTIPDKPSNRLQKYRLTKKGL
jgi:ATP-dependent DNA helicase RecG